MPISTSIALLSVLLLAPTAGAAQTAVPDAFILLESAGRTYRVSGGMCADFRQTLTVPLLGDDRIGTGRLCTQQPGRFAMRFTQPRGDVVLADGTWLWVHTPNTDPRQVLRFQLAQSPRGIDFYREFLDAPRQKYRAEYQGRETVAGKAAHRILLTPLQAAPYRSAEVWIDADGAFLRQIQIREENGSVRIVTLSAIDTRSALAADAFEFVPPAGAQVITR